MSKKMGIIFRRIKRKIKSNLKTISILMIIAIPIVPIAFNGFWLVFAIQFGLMIVSRLFSFLDELVNFSFYDLPVMRKKFVKYDKSKDQLYIDNDDIYEIVNYLYDMQLYYEKHEIHMTF